VVSRFGVIEATGLKLWRRGKLHQHDLQSKFHKNELIGSIVIMWLGGRHRDWKVISYAYFFLEKESRLKWLFNDVTRRMKISSSRPKIKILKKKERVYYINTCVPISLNRSAYVRWYFTTGENVICTQCTGGSSVAQCYSGCPLQGQSTALSLNIWQKIN
jgi:hypothetical protein